MEYIQTLDMASMARYLEKIQVINDKCPYGIEKDLFTSMKTYYNSATNWPEETHPDIVNYLIHTTSAYTLNELKAYKSLELYNYFISGFVIDILHLIENDHSLFMGKVKHSQRMRESPLLPWVIVETDATVLFDHCSCTCMAGREEVTISFFYYEIYEKH